MSNISHIRALEAKRFAISAHGGLEALERLLHPDLIYVHSSGMVDSKVSYLAALEKGEYEYVAFEPRDERIVERDDLVIVNQRARLTVVAKSTGASISREINISSIWMEVDGVWLLSLVHSTGVPDGVASDT